MHTQPLGIMHVYQPDYSMHAILVLKICIIGMESDVILETPHIDDIDTGNVSIELINDDTGAVLSMIPLYRCANRLIGSFVYPPGTMRYRIIGNDINGQPFTTTSDFVQEVMTSFEVGIDSENPINVEQGQTIALNLTLHNHHNNDSNYTFTHEPVPSFVQAFNPTDLMVPPGRSGSVNIIIAIPVDAVPGLHNFVVYVTDGCVIHSVSKNIVIEEPVRISYP